MRFQFRRFVSTLAVASVMFSPLLMVSRTSAAFADASEAEVVTGLTNEVREYEGLAALEFDGALQDMAQQWADELAGAGVLAHNDDIANRYAGSWCWLGENVGRGRSVSSIHRAWLNSYTHYANVVDSGYDRFGVGVAYGDDGRIYIVVNFAGGYC
jgi:uncharacterized protein YkwD